MEIPSSPWRAAPWDPAEALAQAAAVAPERCGEAVRWQALPGSIGHTFTHFHLRLDVRRADHDGPAPAGHVWLAAADIAGEALPSVMRKALEAGCPEYGKSRKTSGRRV